MDEETAIINLVKTVWIAGFRASEEEWNGEVPFGQGGTQEDKEDLNEELESYIKNSELLRKRLAEAMMSFLGTE